MCGVTEKWLLNPITRSVLTSLTCLAGRIREIEEVENCISEATLGLGLLQVGGVWCFE